jgi:hypothetical protein
MLAPLTTIDKWKLATAKRTGKKLLEMHAVAWFKEAAFSVVTSLLTPPVPSATGLITEINDDYF